MCTWLATKQFPVIALAGLRRKSIFESACDGEDVLTYSLHSSIVFVLTYRERLTWNVACRRQSFVTFFSIGFMAVYFHFVGAFQDLSHYTCKTVFYVAKTS